METREIVKPTETYSIYWKAPAKEKGKIRDMSKRTKKKLQAERYCAAKLKLKELEGLISLKEYAKIHNVSETYVRIHVKSGDIDHIRISKWVFFFEEGASELTKSYLKELLSNYTTCIDVIKNYGCDNNNIYSERALEFYEAITCLGMTLYKKKQWEKKKK